jgi:hypothetical protein
MQMTEQQREKIEKIKHLLETVANEIGECRRILKGESEQ